MTVKGYYPEMGEVKPAAQMEAHMFYNGRGYFINSRVKLDTNRSVRFVEVITEKQNPRCTGWYRYDVTLNGFKQLSAVYVISMELLLD